MRTIDVLYQVKATKRQSAEFKEKEAASDQTELYSSPCSIEQASHAFIMATKEGPDLIHLRLLQSTDVYENSR